MNLLEPLEEILRRLTALLRFLRAEWKMTLAYTVLGIFVLWAFVCLLSAFVDLNNLECHTYHIQSTVPTTGQPAIEDKDICHDRRDK